MRKVSIGSSILILFLTIFSCTEGERGLFYSLANEVKIDDTTTLANEISVTGIADTGTQYFITAGTVYWREKTNLDWQPVPPPSGYSLCSDIVFHGGLVYASFYTVDADAGAVYTLDPGAATKTWSASPVYDSAIVVKMLVLNGGIYAVTQQTSGTAKSYAVLEANFSATAVISGEALPIIDGIYDGANYWIVTENKVFIGNSMTNATPPAEQNKASGGDFGALDLTGKFFGGIYYDSGNSRIYLSSTDGYIYTTSDGGTTWYAPSAAFTDSGGTALSFTDMNQVTGDSGFTALIAATDADGYFEFPLGIEANNASFVKTTPGGNYYDTDLRLGSVLCILVDTADNPDTLFLGSAGRGLWRTSYSGTTSLIWKLE